MALVLFAALSASAVATEPKSYELADATHAGSLAITADGTAWFIPTRGTEWKGEDHSVLGSVAPDGTVSEHPVAGLSTVTGLASDPGGELWASGLRGTSQDKVFDVAHLSSTGGPLRAYTAARGQGSIRSVAVSTDAVWLIREGFSSARSAVSIERIDIASGKVRRFPLRPNCHAFALAVAPNGTPWFTQKCGGFLGEGAASKTSLSRIGPGGEIIRRPIASRDYPVTLAIGPDGTVWFGAWRYYQPSQIGRLTKSGDLAEFRLSKGSPYSIAVGPEGRLWFQSSRGRAYARALASIGVGGHVDAPICAEPACRLEPTDITRAPDGSLWYGLRAVNYNTGGGGSGIYIEDEIGNEAGFLGHLTF